MLDVIVAGAGPAGSIAALVLARAGARVVIIDRDAFPRDKLCGDTLNPGALALLASLGLEGGPLGSAMRLSGMLVTGPAATVMARYGDGQTGRAIPRRTFDAWLLEAAVRAGARFEPGLVVTRALTDTTRSRPVVRGVLLRSPSTGRTTRLPALMTIAADGRRSPTALSLGLIAHPRSPRRWAAGTYAEGVAGLGDYGEMHVRHGHYIGVAPLGDGRANVCVVAGGHAWRGRVPAALVAELIAADPRLRDRMAGARFDEVRVVGPLAVDARRAGVRGLLLAGDAAGFVDPMTGDGVSLAMQGAVLAAEQVLAALAAGRADGAVRRLAAARRRVLGSKLRFNRVLRALVDSPAGLRVAAWCGAAMPRVLHRVVARAGDSGVVS